MPKWCNTPFLFPFPRFRDLLSYFFFVCKFLSLVYSLDNWEHMGFREGKVVTSLDDVHSVYDRVKRFNNVDDIDIKHSGYTSGSYRKLYTDWHVSTLLNYLDMVGGEMVIRPKADLNVVEENGDLVRITYNSMPRHIIEFDKKDVAKTFQIELLDKISETPRVLHKTVLKSLALYFDRIHDVVRKNVLSHCKFLIYGRFPDRIKKS